MHTARTKTFYEAYRLDDILHRSEQLVLLVSHKKTGGAAILKGFHEVDAFEWDHGGIRYCKVMECDLLPRDDEEKEYEGCVGDGFTAKLAIHGEKAAALEWSALISIRVGIVRHNRGRYLLYSCQHSPSLRSSRLDLASSLHDLGLALMMGRDYERGLGAVEEAVTIRRAEGVTQDLAHSLHLSGQLYMEVCDFSKAMSVLEEAVAAGCVERAAVDLELCRSRQEEECEGVKKARHSSSQLVLYVESLLQRQHWTIEQIHLLEGAACAQSPVLPVSLLPMLFNRLASHYITKGRFNKVLHLESYDIPKDQPAMAAEYYQLLGMAHFALGAYDHTPSYFRQSLDALREIYPPSHPAIIETLYLFRALLVVFGWSSKGSGLVKEMVGLADACLGKDNVFYSDFIMEWAMLSSIHTRPEGARQIVKELSRLVQSTPSSSGRSHIQLLENLAMTQQEYGDELSARPMLEAALEMRMAVGYGLTAIHRTSPDMAFWSSVTMRRALPVLNGALEAERKTLKDSDLPVTLLGLSFIYQAQTDFQQELSLLQEAYTMVQEGRESRGPVIAAIDVALASVYQSMGDNKKAADLWDAAWSILRMQGGRVGHDMTRMMWCVSRGYAHPLKLKDDLVAYKRTKNQVERLLGSHHPDMAILLLEMAEVHVKMG